MWKIARSCLIALFVVLVAAGGWTAWQARLFLATTPEAGEGTEVLIDVPPGATLARIASSLREKGVITDDFKFRLLARFKKHDKGLQAGRFLFRTNWTPEQVLDTLVNGHPVLTRVTIPEGLTWWQTAKLLADKGFAPYEELRAVIHDPAFLRHYGIPFDNAEGFLMPDTYLLKTPRDDSPADPKQAWKVCGRLVDNFWTRSAAIWPNAKKPGTEELRRAVILASIVERETAITAERPRVAGVYANRLKTGMLLQADPTVIYGIGEAFQGNLTRSMLNDEKNVYNTYRRPGLPPGPICSFSITALRAALNPEKHDYLYFVAITDGGAHSFSKTLKEHNQAVRRYLQNRRQNKQ